MVALDAVDVGQQQQRIGAELVGEQGGREVLVDDGLDAVQGAVGSRRHGNSAAARADHDDAGVEEPANGLQLDDLARLGRRRRRVASARRRAAIDQSRSSRSRSATARS